MKNLNKIFLLSALAILLVLSTASCDTYNYENVRIFTAQDLITEYSEGRIVPSNLAITESTDGTNHYMRATATDTTKHVLAWTLAEEIAPDFDTMIISFKTNYTDTTSSSKSTQLDFPKDSTFDYKNRYFALYCDRSGFEVKDGIIEEEIMFSGLLENFTNNAVPAVKYIKINPCAGKELVLANGTDPSSIWFEIEYVGFFKTEDDANSFNYDAYRKKFPQKSNTTNKLTESKENEPDNVAERTDKPFITGYDGFEFRPDNNMTRAEACTVVTRLLVDESTLDNSGATAFTDLNKDAWYYKYVTYLESIGYLKSYNGEFKPDQKITRAEFVELVYQMGKITGGDKVVSFKDVPQTHPKYEVIMAAAKAGLVNGKSADTFDPDGDITRSEVVKVLCTALGRVPGAKTFDKVAVAGFSDITDKHWAYPYVMEAAFEHTVTHNENGEEIWLSVNDTNDYYAPVPDGLIDQLNATFAERVEEIRNTESEWTLAPGGTVWYFSYSEGSNDNDGKSPQTPLKTLAKLDKMRTNSTIKAGDVVLFKRGDEWHEQLVCASGITYSAYGEGPKPLISPSVEANEASDWEETDSPGVYKYKSRLKHKKDIANIVFNDGECYGQRVVKDPGDGTKTYTAGSDFMVSNGIDVWYQPIRKFNGYATLAEIAAETEVADLMFYYDRATGDLYLYSRTGNPADRFDTIDLCTHGHGISARNTKNVTIDNLCVLYAGSHGVSSNSTVNLTVRNCEVGWIGGAHQKPDDLTSRTRYGNGIEVYGIADGFYVYNNYIHDCFDCGPTIQWSGSISPGQKMISKNIEIHSNVVWEGSLEVWFSVTTAPTEDTYAILENCRLYNNLVTGSGHGWKTYNHYKFEWTSFYGGGGTNAYYNDCYIENNYFWGIKRHLMKAVPTTTVNGNGFEWRNNVIIHPDKEGSIGYMGKDAANGKGKKTQYFYDKDTVNTLVKNGALGINKFYYTPGDAANRRNIISY